MPRTSRAWRGMSGLVLAAFLVSSCAGGAQSPTAAGTVAPAPRTSPSADAFTCASVQALLGHLTVTTVHWSPTYHPFDPAVAAQIRTTSIDLQKQLQTVRTVAVLRAVSSTAKAFNAVATAMSLKERAQVSRAITASKVAYRQFKKACGA
jgi:hypothetical protein